MDGATERHFDGKLDRPRLFVPGVRDDEVAFLEEHPDDPGALSGLLGAWDFSADISSDLVTDISGNANHGRVFNMPTRGVTGHNHTGTETCFRLAPSEYGAIHFHICDDLETPGAQADFELTVPADLPSGVYAAWLRAGADEEYLPFVVRPPRGAPTERVAVLMSTMTYVAYANFTDIGKRV